MQVVDQSRTSLFPYFPEKAKEWVLCLLAILLFLNTTGNKYTFDDMPVIKENKYIQQGFEGIGDILSSDMFASMYEDYNSDQQLSGGRYRPVSMVTFAIEHQLLGENPLASHLINALLFGIVVLLLYRLLANSLNVNIDITFMSVLLFAIHPIHTEVVANIKSRDELLSMLFIISCFIFSFKYLRTGSSNSLLLAVATYLLAFLSKEYAFALLLLIPVTAYLFDAFDRKKIIRLMLTLLSATGLYIFIRISAVGVHFVKQNDILNNPYLYAPASEALATKIYVLFKYILLLLWPAKLSSDYSFNTIPYVSFSNLLVICSVIIHIGLLILCILGLKRKQIWGFAILWYLAFIFPVSNLLFDIGATMGERLVFHASFGFCLLLGYWLTMLFRKLPTRTVQTLLVVLTLIAGGKIIARNKAWKDDSTLFSADIKTAPNSILVNNNVANILIQQADSISDLGRKSKMLDSAMRFTSKALQYYPQYTNALLNHALIYQLQGHTDSAMKYWLIAKSTLPNDPHIPRISDYLYSIGTSAGLKDIPKAIYHFRLAISIYDKNAAAWSDLGGAYYTIKNYDSAAYCWKQALSINPNNANAKNGYRALTQNGVK